MASSARQRLDMPGLFTPDHSGSRTGSNTNLFAPAPRFPITSETTGRQMTDSAAHETRKRSRLNGDSTSNFTTSHTPAANAWADSSLAYSRSTSARSPPPLANDRYELAGGMERTSMFGRQNGDYDDYFHLERQRGMWSTPTSPPTGLPDHFSNTTATKPWVLNQILSIVGGVAGKLVQFCAVPFRGFQAGGGQAYTFDSQGEIAKAGPQDDPFIDQAPTAAPIQGPLPGEYPEDDYGVRSIDSLENERPRMSKRLRTGENWVLVDQDGETYSRPATPRLSERRVPNHARSPSQIPRPASRAGATTATPKRPSLIPVSRRSTLDRKSFQGASKMPSKQYSSPRSYNRESYGSPAMFKDTSNTKQSPLPPESQRLINKMRREELEDDARMRRMSSQMSTMLREAQEALGSKFEIGDDGGMGMGMGMDDEGFSEERSWYQR